MRMGGKTKNAINDGIKLYCELLRNGESRTKLTVADLPGLIGDGGFDT
jgi:hypothetical protein